MVLKTRQKSLFQPGYPLREPIQFSLLEPVFSLEQPLPCLHCCPFLSGGRATYKHEQRGLCSNNLCKNPAYAHKQPQRETQSHLFPP